MKFNEAWWSVQLDSHGPGESSALLTKSVHCPFFETLESSVLVTNFVRVKWSMMTVGISIFGIWASPDRLTTVRLSAESIGWFVFMIVVPKDSMGFVWVLMFLPVYFHLLAGTWADDCSDVAIHLWSWNQLQSHSPYLNADDWHVCFELLNWIKPQICNNFSFSFASCQWQHDESSSRLERARSSFRSLTIDIANSLPMTGYWNRSK